ncbi:Hypothetical predicted protein [Olea europaea subsp. europaea]|uniref:Starch synthase catalytic domain-containing protein n=1 Tax=Olea europaea subsp. europaea TaxID=158383 RepID=A0A8S0UCW4_OLEEU|nr:Hypothetical predicted protein [Olea europaea subsp. europaea]
MLANGKYETILTINIEDNDVNLTERRDLKYMQIAKEWKMSNRKTCTEERIRLEGHKGLGCQGSYSVVGYSPCESMSMKIMSDGLGDVAGALPKSLARHGHRVMVVAPRYGNYAEPQHSGVRKMYKIDGQDMEVTYFQTYIDGVDFVFTDSPVFQYIENNIYGGNHVDILKRMVLFCKAAFEVPWLVPCGSVCYGDGNLVFIANDWRSALLPVYLKVYYRNNGLMKYTRSFRVIHNIAHQKCQHLMQMLR